MAHVEQSRSNQGEHTPLFYWGVSLRAPRRAGGLAIWLALALVVGSCTPAPATPLASSPPTSMTATVAPPTDVPVEGGTGVLVYGANQPMESIDPAVGYTTWSRYITDNVYDALFRFEGAPPKLVNDLAESYEASPDGREWVFHIRPGVKFHDGSVLTAADVKYTLDRMLGMQDAPSYMWANIDLDRTEVVDDYTVKIVLKDSYGPFLYTLPWLYIVNEDLVRAHEVNGDWGREWLLSNEAGSGPFTITSFQPDVRVEMAYFPDYWEGWPEKHLDGWVYEIHLETATLKQLLQSGDIHMTDWLTPDAISQVGQNENIVVHDNPTMTPFVFKLNNQKEPTSNRDFRMALTYAVDYEAIIKELFGGAATPLDGPLTADFPGHVSFAQPQRDLELAREYLEKSGYAPGSVKMAFEYVSGDATQENLGLLLQQDFKDLGIEMTVQGFTWPVSQERYKTPETAGNIYPIWESADYPDAEAILYQYYHSLEPGTWFSVSHYDNPEYDQLIDTARTLPREEDRVPIYQQLQQILVDDATDIWVMAQNWEMATLKCVQGYSFQPAGMLSTYFYPVYLEGCE